MKLRLLSVLAFIVLVAMKGDKPAYEIFQSNGKSVKYKKVLKEALEADVILFGEMHNNPVIHWLQYELMKDLHTEVGDKLILGAEMFETDDQLLLDEYLQGLIKTSNFEKEAKLWPNYQTDYKPVLEFAKEKNLDFIATNIPRRYASFVFKNGLDALDSLSEEARQYLPPLPIEYDGELKNYKAMLSMGGMGGGHANPNLPKAQAVKDATMAHNIIENWEANETFLHLNGTYHSEDFEGIVWYLKKANPELNILTIAALEQSEIDSLSEDAENKASFIIAVPETMTKTH